LTRAGDHPRSPPEAGAGAGPGDHPGSSPEAGSLADAVIEAARELGFHRVGIAPVEASQRKAAYEDWLNRGFHGEMDYLATPAHREARGDVGELVREARSIVVVALGHPRRDLVPLGRADAVRGSVARYARGEDYHLVMRQKLRQLADRLAELAGRPIVARSCVDTAPLLERDLAERAGLGFIAKNTMLIAPGLGSYVMLGELVTDLDLVPTAPAAHGPRCGGCRACLDACPTGAFADPFVLDARRCISYLTIELAGPMPRDLRPLVGRRIFGCDVCQEVCPYNAGPERAAAPELAPRSADHGAPDLLALVAIGQNQYRQLVKRSAMRRLSRARLLRNVCVALGNAGDPRAVAPLAARLTSDPSPLVRGHAAWALGRLGGTAELAAARAAERDVSVIEEIDAALAG
jgi:epoxyqueuosine reductase